MKFSGLLGSVVLFAAVSASAVPGDPPQNDSAQENAAMMQKIRDLEDRVIALEGQLRTMKAQQAAPAATPNAPASASAPATEATSAAEAAAAAAPAMAATTQTQAVSLGGAGGSAAKALNPDISAIGDFIGVAGHNPVQPSPSLQMHESELGFQAIIDLGRRFSRLRAPGAGTFPRKHLSASPTRLPPLRRFSP